MLLLHPNYQVVLWKTMCSRLPGLNPRAATVTMTITPSRSFISRIQPLSPLQCIIASFCSCRQRSQSTTILNRPPSLHNPFRNSAKNAFCITWPSLSPFESHMDGSGGGPFFRTFSLLQPKTWKHSWSKASLSLSSSAAQHMQILAHDANDRERRCRSNYEACLKIALDEIMPYFCCSAKLSCTTGTKPHSIHARYAKCNCTGFSRFDICKKKSHEFPVRLKQWESRKGPSKF